MLRFVKCLLLSIVALLIASIGSGALYLHFHPFRFPSQNVALRCIRQRRFAANRDDNNATVASAVCCQRIASCARIEKFIGALFARTTANVFHRTHAADAGFFHSAKTSGAHWQFIC